MTYNVVEGTDCKNLVSDAGEASHCTDLSSMYICIYCTRRVLNNLVFYEAIYSEWLEFRYCLAFDDKIRPSEMFSFCFISRNDMSSTEIGNCSKLYFSYFNCMELI